MVLITQDVYGNDVKVRVYDQHLTIPIYEPTEGGILVCSWYTFERLDGKNNNDIQPFVYFCKDSLNIYCNDSSKAKYEYLSEYARSLIETYYGELRHLNYSNDFENFILVNTTPSDDDDTSKIVWTLGNKITYYYNDDGTVWTIQSDGTQSHFKLMTGFLRTVFEKRIKQHVNLCIRAMKLLDKVYECRIEDPDCSDYIDGSNSSHELTVGVFGTNYSTNKESYYQTENHETARKSVVKYTPFVYFMSPERQKILIIHELVHTKIGNEHGHDEYFWYLLEFYSGFKREDDFAFNKKQCLEDTITYDKYHSGLTNLDLINKHKNWIASGRKGGQW